jgi:hypothetical protein
MRSLREMVADRPRVIGMRMVGPLMVMAPRMSPAASKTGADRPEAESSRSLAVIA